MRMTLLLFLLLSVAIFMGLACNSHDGGTVPVPTSCSLTMLAPLAGDSFQSDDIANIRWEEKGDVDSVGINLYQGGTQVGVITKATENDGFFPWRAQVMNGQGGDFEVEISAIGQDSCTARSGLFTIINTNACDLNLMAIINPDTTLRAGRILPITWESHDTMGSVNIELWHGHLNNVLVGTIAENIPDGGQYNWLVDSFNNAAHREVNDFSVYWLRLYDPNVPACGDSSINFTIYDPDLCVVHDYITPFGESLADGDTVMVGFTVNDFEPDDMVKIRLYAGNVPVPGGYITLPGEEIPASSSLAHPWVVSDYGFTTGGNYFNVRVIKVSDPYCWGKTANFSIHH